MNATLGDYKKLVTVLFGEQSGALKFLNDKIKVSKNGENEEVIADKSQMLYILANLHYGSLKDGK